MKSMVTTGLLLLLLGVSALGYTGKLQIPPQGTSQMITLQDGSTLMGKITAVNESDVKFQTDMGEMTIEIAKIKEIKEVSAASIKSGQYWFPNPNRTRLLIGPTSRTLAAGKGYFYDLWIFFPGAAYGITKNFMISGGISVIPGVHDQMYYVMPKVGFPAAKNFDVSATLAIFRLWEQTFYFGLGGMTIGTDDRSLTCALGIAFTDEKMADKPAAMVGGEYRLARRVSLVGESWFIPGDDDNGILGLGALRLMGEQMTVDIGFGVSYDDKGGELDYYGNPEPNETDWVPYIDFVWNF